jgi:uncharacterized protein
LQYQTIYFLKVSIAEEEFTLCFEKCMLRHSDHALLIADLHIGKSNHFRKAGIAVPNKIAFDEIDKLNAVIQKYQPNKIVFLGDLFHSAYNQSVDLLHQLIDNECNRSFILVEGNHDIMHSEVYQKLGIEVLDNIIEKGIIYTHEPIQQSSLYNVFGHIHPGVMLTSKGRQSLRLPCFFIGPDYMILPAFGVFTGLAMMKATQDTEVYVIADQSVIKVS